MQKLLKEAYKIAIFRGNYENRRQLAFLKIVTKGAKKSLPLFLCLIFFGGMFANYAFRKREVLSENYAFRKQNPTVCELRFLQTKTTCLRVTLSANKAHLSANYAFRKQKPTCLRITLFANKGPPVCELRFLQTKASSLRITPFANKSPPAYELRFSQTKPDCLRIAPFVNKAYLPANYAFRKQSPPVCELHLS